MADLKTKYLGIELKNPFIVGASNLVTDVNNLKKLQQAGAGAVVYKSLFEEQIQLEALEMDQDMSEYEERHAEMTSIFPQVEHAGPKEHLLNLKKAKEALNIPLFASLNAVYDFSWLDYAKELENTGVDALELNFYSTPEDFDTEGKAVVESQLKIIKEIKEKLSIPVSVKLSPYYTNPLGVIAKMDKAGADGLVLFNRLFQPQIDIEAEEHHFPWNLSQPGDNRLPLRFAGLLHGNIDADVCSNTGILSAPDAIQMLLAGAQAVQVVSALYLNKIDYLTTMVTELGEWMDKKGYKTLCDFRGKLSQQNTKDIYAYKRSQYVDILWNSERIFNKYPMR